jgi:phospholipid/cholesterol/gamma-HCH transport system substrate-binding protein
MRGYTDRQIARLGAITIVILLVVMAAAFNLSKFPGFGGSVYTAEFTDASGLREGNMVQIAGMRAGRVEDIVLAGDKVVVEFRVDDGYEFGTESAASVQVLNLLGEKYLELRPAGGGQLDTEDTIPLARTDSAYDIVGVLGDLTQTTERIDTDQLGTALDTLSKTLDDAAPEIRSSFRGISRLSRTIATRDAELQQLLQRSDSVSKLLADRSDDLVVLMREGDKVFQEVRARKRAIHRLLVNTRTLSTQLEGVARDNEKQLGPALRELRQVLAMLQEKKKELRATAAAIGPYADILGNIVGTGPWFDGYVVNLLGIPSGEFVPGTGGDF